jgi:hypothetical protein
LKEAHGALREAMQGFEGLGAMADADATRRELGKLALAVPAR